VRNVATKDIFVFHLLAVYYRAAKLVLNLNFILDKDVEAANKAASIILKGTNLLKVTPRIGRPMSDDSGRRELFLAFAAGAYVIRYKLETEAIVVIIRIWHSRENRGPMP
ncbi:MAG: type II toxin-antitoxin system RelE/ParE family toxin, partial [Candidatus Saccharimonadales bacterium]